MRRALQACFVSPAVALVVVMALASGCEPAPAAAPVTAPPAQPAADPSAQPVVLGLKVPAFQGCEPSSLAVDGGGRFLLAVACPPSPPGSATATARPAPAPVPSGPPPTGAPTPRGTLTALGGDVGTPVAGGRVIRASASARVAAGAAGHAYLVDGGPGTAFQLTTVFTRDGGQSWFRLDSPDPDSHFMEGRVAAEGDRVLFGALEIGRGPSLQLPLPARLWTPPADGALPVPSTTVVAGEDLVVHLRPGTRTALLACRTSARSLAIFGSDDGGGAFVHRQDVSLDFEPGPVLFTPDELLVLSAGGALRALPLPGAGAGQRAPEDIPAGWPSGESPRAQAVDARGRLWAFTSSATGPLWAWRLRRSSASARQWTGPVTLGGPVDGRVAAAALPDGGVLVAFTRGDELQVQAIHASD